MIKRFIILLLLVSSQLTIAQPLGYGPKPKPYIWMVGVSWNAIVDHGRQFCQPFDINQSWNYEVYPTRVMVDRYLKHGLSVEFSGAYANYKLGKLINDSTNRSGIFLAFDANCKYSFFDLIAPNWLDPYTSLGIGLTQRQAMPVPMTLTGNFAIGVNFYVWKGLGIQVQTSGKFGLTNGFMKDGDYFQHNLGLVYKWTPRKKQDNSFNKRQYKWTHKKQKYKDPKRKG